MIHKEFFSLCKKNSEFLDLCMQIYRRERWGRNEVRVCREIILHCPAAAGLMWVGNQAEELRAQDYWFIEWRSFDFSALRFLIHYWKGQRCAYLQLLHQLSDSLGINVKFAIQRLPVSSRSFVEGEGTCGEQMFLCKVIHCSEAPQSKYLYWIMARKEGTCRIIIFVLQTSE